MWTDNKPGTDVVDSIEYSANFYTSTAVNIIHNFSAYVNAKNRRGVVDGAAKGATVGGANAEHLVDDPARLFLYFAIQNVREYTTVCKQQTWCDQCSLLTAHRIARERMEDILAQARATRAIDYVCRVYRPIFIFFYSECLLLLRVFTQAFTFYKRTHAIIGAFSLSASTVVGNQELYQLSVCNLRQHAQHARRKRAQLDDSAAGDADVGRDTACVQRRQWWNR
jgi:hypothetical protein